MKTYTIILTSQGMAIHCDICGAVSWNQNDIEHKYCSNCKVFHDDPLPDIRHIPQPTIVGLLEQFSLHSEAINLLRRQMRQLAKQVAELEKGKADENH